MSFIEGTERVTYRGRWKHTPMPPSAYANDEELAGIRREFKQRWGIWFTRIIGISGLYRPDPKENPMAKKPVKKPGGRKPGC